MKRANDLSNRQQRRWAATSDPGFTGVRQEVENVPLLLSQSHHNGQDPLDKSAAVFTLSTETASTPDHTPTKSSFCGVIGRFHTFLIKESPQRLLHLENIPASSAGDPKVHEGTDVQQGADFPADGLHGSLEVCPGQGAIPYAMPPGERLLGLCEQQAPDRLGMAASLYQSLKVAFEMCPTGLPFVRVQPVVGAVAVRADNAFIVFAQQGLRSGCAAGLQYPEHSHGRGGSYPEPEVLRPLLPASLIQVHHRLLLNILVSFFNRLLHCLADELFH